MDKLKYMKYLLTFLMLIGVAYAQEPAYTPMRLNYQFRGIKVDSLFLIPSFNDTISANSSTMKNVAGAMIRTGNDFWMRNAATTAWLQNVNVGSGSSTSVQFVDSIYRIAGKDSIFWRKGGVVSKIKDSSNGNLTLQNITDNGNTTNDSIGLGVSPPVYRLDVNGEIQATTGIRLANNGAKTGFYGGANIIDFWTGNTKVATMGLTAYPGTFTDFYNSFAFSSATSGTNNAFKIRSGVVSTAANSAGVTQLNISPEYVQDTFGTGTLRGIYYNPTVTSLNTSKHIAFENSSGDIVHKNIQTSGNDQIVTVDSIGKLKKDSRFDLTTNKITIQTDSLIIEGKKTILYKDTSHNLISQVKMAYADQGIDITGADYNILVPGLYIISAGSLSYNINLPDASLYKGQSIQIVNMDSNKSGLASATGSILDRGSGLTFTYVTENKMMVLYSDGADWYGFEL